MVAANAIKGTHDGKTACSYKAALAANTVYALVVTEDDTTFVAAGVTGPVTLSTFAGAEVGATGVCLDTNTVLDSVTVLAKPTEGLTLTVTKDALSKDTKMVPNALVTG
jgi:hypothetical protein